ncbi:MAG: hypothetical protein AAF645_18265 [Myxococcota bacterium]
MSASYERLKHDVAKYVQRTVRNLPVGGDVPSALVPLLLRDAYGDRSDRTAARYERDAGALKEDARRRCDDAVTRLAALELAAREGDSAALQAVAEQLRVIAAVIAGGQG